jgi:predicted nucleic acid-binding protein
MEENKIIVLDASVALKWFLGEKESFEEAQNLLLELQEGKHKILVPFHFMSEVANTLSRKVPDLLLEALSHLRLLGVKEVALNLDNAAIALDLIKRHPSLAFYDTAYHALAIRHKSDFVTADKKYCRNAKGESHLRLLGDS